MYKLLILLLACTACVKPPTLPVASLHNVVGTLNDSAWFATGKALRLVRPSQQPNSVKQFNLIILTDIDYPGNGSASRSPSITGCASDCVPTQRLHVYNIPLKKGKFKLHKLDKKRTDNQERTNYWLLINGGGMNKNYRYEGGKPRRIWITKYDQRLGVIEGFFSFDLDENLSVYNRLNNSIPPVARFHQVLFRVNLEDVKLKE